MKFQRQIRIPVLIALACLGVPRAAHASGYVNIGLGVSFSNPTSQIHPAFVADFGWLPREPLGVEVDVTVAPRFFRDSGLVFTDNRVTTVMANVIVAGFDRGGRSGFRRPRRGAAVRPFVSGGLGLMSESVGTAALSVSNQHLGVNAGIGVMALSRRSVGVRAEVRYFHDLVSSSAGSGTGIDFGSFHFWRASIGAVLTF